MKKLLGDFYWVFICLVFWAVVVPPMYFLSTLGDHMNICTKRPYKQNCGMPMSGRNEGFGSDNGIENYAREQYEKKKQKN